jgi:hypothetical protein
MLNLAKYIATAVKIHENKITGKDLSMMYLLPMASTKNVEIPVPMTKVKFSGILSAMAIWFLSLKLDRLSPVSFMMVGP